MNPPQVYMCSPSWTLLPPPSHSIPLGRPSALEQRIVDPQISKEKNNRTVIPLMSIHSFPIFNFSYKILQIVIQLFQGIENISMSVIKSEICHR